MIMDVASSDDLGTTPNSVIFPYEFLHPIALQ